jgi:hypothetical protein
MNKPYNIQNTNICNGIFHISFFKALLINEGETTQGGEQDSGRNDPVLITIKSNEHKIKKSKQIAIKSLIKIVSIVFN